MYFEDGVWNVVLWPSNTSNYKDEVRYLRSAVDKMMDDIETLRDESQDLSDLQIIVKKAELVEIALRELNRQVSREHGERGNLMTHLLDLYSGLFSELPGIYNGTLEKLQKEKDAMAERMVSADQNATEREQRAEEEVKSLKILLDMQQQWHTDVDAQIDHWKESVQSFKEKLKSELKMQKDQYEERIMDLQAQLDSAIAERDAYRSQIEWEQKSISDREAEVIEMRAQLKETKASLDERDQTLYTTRTHFERQFTFMREQMGQMLSKGGGDDNQLRDLTQYLPQRQGEQLPFLAKNEVNRRIMSIYIAKARHDAAYPKGTEPPLYKFVIKYHIATTFGYKAAVPAIWQFISSCSRYRHESTGVGIFMEQLENQSNMLPLIQYLAKLVQRDSIGENGLPRLTIPRCAEIAAKVLPESEIERLKRLVEKKIVNPKKGMFIDFDLFLQIVIDLTSDVTHDKKQRIMYQFEELLKQPNPVDWPSFNDFVTRFAPGFSNQKIGDLFITCIQSSLPDQSVTSQAFQLIVDQGIFEEFEADIGSDIDVANPDETAQFVNMRWVSDIETPVSNAITELRAERLAECHKYFNELCKINAHMKTPCSREDAGTGLSLLHQAALILIRYKFVKIARKDSLEAQKEVRKLVDLVWS